MRFQSMSSFTLYLNIDKAGLSPRLNGPRTQTNRATLDRYTDLVTQTKGPKLERKPLIMKMVKGWDTKFFLVNKHANFPNNRPNLQLRNP